MNFRNDESTNFVKLYPFHTEVENTKEENRIKFFPNDQ